MVSPSDLLINEISNAIPSNYFIDLADILFLITLLVVIDVFTRVSSEVVRYNHDTRRNNTVVNIILGILYRAWGTVNGKRYLLSKRFIYGICIKTMLIYLPMLILSCFIWLLPDRITICDLRIDETLSNILLITPIISEWFSIIENIQELYSQNNKMLDGVASVFSKLGYLLKWLVDKT